MRREWGLLWVMGLFMFACAVLVSCTPYPQKDYYELEEAIELATSEEERAYYEARQDHIEKEVMKAEQFLTELGYCYADRNCIPVCQWQYSYMEDPFDFFVHDITDIEKLYRWWMKIKPPTCFFQLRY